MVCTLPGIRLPSSVPSIHKLSGSSFNGGDHRRNPNLSLFRNKASVSRKIFAQKSSHDLDSPPTMSTEPEKVLVPGGNSESSLLDEELIPDPTLDLPVLEADIDLDGQTLKGSKEIVGEHRHLQSKVMTDDEQDSMLGSHVDTDKEVLNVEKSVASRLTKRTVPPPGNGQKIYETDPILRNHQEHLDYRYGQYKKLREAIDEHEGGIEQFSRGYEKLGFSRSATGITYREWAPGAKSASLIGDFNDWNPNADVMTRPMK